MSFRRASEIHRYPQPLDKLICDLLAKSPERRPASAATVAQTLESLLTDNHDSKDFSPSDALPSTRSWTPRKSSGHSRLWIAVTLTAGALIVVSAIVVVLLVIGGRGKTASGAGSEQTK